MKKNVFAPESKKRLIDLSDEIDQELRWLASNAGKESSCVQVIRDLIRKEYQRRRIKDKNKRD